jgi:hypothetical protein
MPKKNENDLKFDEQSWHDHMAKVTATLPPDVAKSVMHTVDEAGATQGTLLLLEILRHIRIGDRDELAELAREAVKKKR